MSGQSEADAKQCHVYYFTPHSTALLAHQELTFQLISFQQQTACKHVKTKLQLFLYIYVKYIGHMGLMDVRECKYLEHTFMGRE